MVTEGIPGMTESKAEEPVSVKGVEVSPPAPGAMWLWEYLQPSISLPHLYSKQA